MKGFFGYLLIKGRFGKAGGFWENPVSGRPRENGREPSTDFGLYNERIRAGDGAGRSLSRPGVFGL